MRIGVIGSGRVGSTLGRIWADAGHALIFGSRNPGAREVQARVAEIPGARVTDPASAIAESEAVLIAVPASQVVDLVESLPGWSGRTLIDATNDFAHLDSSNAESLQRAAPGSHVVKAFNVLGVEAMQRVADEGLSATLPIAGNDDGAVAVAFELARDAGFAPLHVGGLGQAASLERLASVWIDWSRTLGRRFLWRIQP